MNEKCSSLVRSNAQCMGVPDPLNMTSSVFMTNRSLISSQYTHRRMLGSQKKDRRSKNHTHINFHIPMTPETAGYGSFAISTVSGLELIPKKEQKLKYTMDQLKLQCNKNTFLKFYQLKKKLEEKDQLSALAIKANPRLWRPQVREEATFDVVFDKYGQSKGYLIGGFNGNGIKQISQLTLQTKPKPILDWQVVQIKGHDKLESKFGQATCVDGEIIYISGGADLSFKNTRK